MAKLRGIFERPAGSGIWWIQFFAEGKRHRQKAGRKSDAIKLYQLRKAEVHAGITLPGFSRGRVKFGELITDAIAFSSEHKSITTYRGRGEIIRKDWGERIAAGITPQELDVWLKGHCKTSGTFNRYRSFFSLCFREGMMNSKVSVNPARLVRHRREPKGRQRFLTRDEYDRLKDLIGAVSALRLAEFVVSVHTGMRMSEQYGLTWRQVHLHRRVIELTDTKNGESRTVHLNQASYDAIMSVALEKSDKAAKVFPHKHKLPRNDAWFLPLVHLAGIDDYTWHNNRHTFCSWLAMAGASTREIMEAAGHKSIAMAARYSHLSPAHTSAVVDRLVR